MASLGEYLARTGQTQIAFAEKIGVKQGTVSRLSKGLISPSLDLAVKIESATSGQVPVRSWVSQSISTDSAPLSEAS